MSTDRIHKGAYRELLHDHAGVAKRPRNELASRLAELLKMPSLLNPHAPKPPPLTVHRCCDGPECSHTSERWECHCEPRPPEQDPPRSCIRGGQPRRDREDGSVDVYRCRQCDVCQWEAEAERWHADRPWVRELQLDRPLERPTFFSVDAAIVAWAEWERHDRWGPSAMGPMIGRLQQASAGAEPGTNFRRDREDPLLRRTGDLVPVRRALETAYTRDNAWGLSPVTCQVLLCARAGGLLPRRPSWVELTAEANRGRDPEHLLTKGTVRSIVRHGERYVTTELAARGVVPMPPRSWGWHEAIVQRRESLERNERWRDDV